MFVIGNLLHVIARVIDISLTIYMWIIIAQAVISWVNPNSYNPIVRFLYAATEPILYPIRRKLPISFGGIDFSPMVAILAIIFLQKFLVKALMQMAGGLAH